MESYGLSTQDIFATELPFSLEAEQSVLGAIIIDPSCMADVLEHLHAEHFHRPHHQELFSLLLAMYGGAQPIDPVTTLDAAASAAIFASRDDAKLYITQLVQMVPTTSNVGSYAKIVKEKYYLRSLISASRDIIEEASGHGADANELIDFAEQRIFDIRTGRDATGLMELNRAVLEAYDTLQKLAAGDKSMLGISTGFTGIDRLITGLKKSDFVLLAARPAMGKTALALNIAVNAAQASGKPVAIFSLEMSAPQLAQRIISSEAMVEGDHLNKGTLTPEEWNRIGEGVGLLFGKPILIDDTPAMTVPQMKAKLRRVKDLGLVIIDYLQLMSTGRRNDNRVQEISEITRSLKNMAKELDVPVLTLSQLTRGPESRSEHRPMLADLRESGSIEQDADIVMFLYRDEYYNPDTTEERGVAECIIAKNRHGEVGKVKLSWQGEYTRFSTMEFYRDED